MKLIFDDTGKYHEPVCRPVLIDAWFLRSALAGLCFFMTSILVAQTTGLPDDLLIGAQPVTHEISNLPLPLPKTPAGPAIMRQARAVQVAFVAFDPVKDPLPVAMPGKAVPASRTVPVVETKPVETKVKATVSSPKTNPVADSPKPAVTSAKTPVVKAPVPIQRSTSPVTIKAASPVVSPSPSPATLVSASPQPVGDPHKLPEYQQIQLPAPASLPTPASSLPVASQDISGTQGQTITVRLQGRGWMFTGTGKTPAGVSFMEKLVQQDAEQFRFRLDETGKLGLQFQRQDVASGLMERQVASLTVVARGASLTTPTVTVANINTNGASQYQPEFPVYQERNLPKTTTALAASTKPNPAVNQSVINLGIDSPQSNAPIAEEAIPGDAAGLLAMAKRRDAAKQSGAALVLYEKILKDFPAYGLIDEVLFRMGKNLEGASDGRNLRRAYDLFVRLQNEYPYSSWVEQAKERARYINRTYFRQ